MPSIPIDIITLLELPNDLFVPEAFRVIIGREPDIFGLMHYAQRLQRGLPRMLVLAELRVSPEGQAHAVQAASPELDKLVARYLIVRNVPLKNLRWAFLPTFGAHIPKEPGFNWEHWANDAIDEHLNVRAEHAALQRATQEVITAQSGMPIIDDEQFRQKLDNFANIIQSATSTMQEKEKGAHEQELHDICNATIALRSTPPDMDSVSWEARQSLYWFFHVLRR